MSPFTADLDPQSKSCLHMKLFRNVQNVSEIRKKIMTQELQCCIIKPSLIFDPFQVVVAANKAVVAEKTTTKSIYTEILFNLSISKNITQSLLKFGIDDKDKDILVVTIINQDESGTSNDTLYSSIVGEETDLDELRNLTNLHDVKKGYKINERESKEITLLDSVISRIATKDYVSH